MSNANNKPALIAYTVENTANDKAIFTRVGAAWPNSKGGFQVKRSAIPVNGELVLLPPKESESE